MKKIDYEALTDDLIENYVPEKNPEIYSLYTSMHSHLMKVYRISNSTAYKLICFLERRLDIHFYRDYELTRMYSLGVKKAHDTKLYCRMLYWSQKISLETVNDIYQRYGDISTALVKKYKHETDQLTDEKIDNYNYAHEYYSKNRQRILQRHKEYRERIRREKLKDINKAAA